MDCVNDFEPSTVMPKEKRESLVFLSSFPVFSFPKISIPAPRETLTVVLFERNESRAVLVPSIVLEL